GPDAVNQAKDAMLRDILVPWPKFCATIEQDVFPAGVTFDSVIQQVHEQAATRVHSARANLSTVYAQREAYDIAEQFSSGRRLRVLGITSRFTTFLQHSMRDWLGA